MSAMFDYIKGDTHGEVGRARASEEYALNHLEVEIKENERLRQALHRIADAPDSYPTSVLQQMARDTLKE